ncbi:TadE/TadG family type IV pilus assembly protein [Streptomyces sp. NPDC059076]|uniref:TadE/TadG family type IV pilus assembly protein n=1 Tax=unclassified Streptomyces TaxID=2593676 RepID=UPI003680968D
MSRHRQRQRERGQAAVEYAGVIALLLFVALAAIQLGVAAYAAQQAGTAARAGARAASMPDGDGRAGLAADAAVSSWLTPKTQSGSCGDQITVSVTIDIPQVLPIFDFGSARRSVTMPCD